jgi:hypothetical protein
MGVNKQKKPLPQERWGNLVNGRLTDKQIFDLFDEFGMAKRLQTKEDYEWVRHNLPNIPEEINKILKIELDKENHSRKTEFQKLKDEAAAQKIKNKTVNNNDSIDNGEGGPAGKTFYRQGTTLIDASTGQRITVDDWRNNWSGKATEVPAPTQNAANTPAPSPQTVSPIPATSSLNKEGLTMEQANDPKYWSNGKYVGYDTTISNTMSSNVPTSSDLSFLKFPPNSTVWLANKKTKELYPIMSEQAMRDLYPGNDLAYQSAINSINEMTPEEFNMSEWKDYNQMSADYGIYEGGKFKNNLGFSTADIQSAYGKTKNDDANSAGLNALTSFFTLLSQPDSGINNTFLNKIKNDKNLMAFYWTALAYGDYTNDDIYKDIKRRELVDQGQTELNNISVISPTIKADDYIITDQGRLATSLPSLEPPAQIGNISRELWKTTAANLNQEYFNLSDPEKYDPTSSVFKDDLAKMKIEAYDYYERELNAETAEEKAAIDSEWKRYVDDVYRTTGYRLGDNALAAWRQLEKIDKEFNEAGIGQTGLENQAVDEALRDYREQNRQIRESRESEIQTKEEQMARASYSPDQIQKLNDEDAAKGLPRSQWRTVLWGLTPAEKMTPEKFIAEHRKNYPNTTLTDAEIKAQFYDNIYDANGNRRSTLYQSQQDKLSREKYGRAIGDELGTDYESAKAQLKMQERLKAEEALQKDFTENDLSSGKAFDKENPIDYGDPNAKGINQLHSLTAQYPETTKTNQTGATGATGNVATLSDGTQVYTGNRIATQYDPKTNKTLVINPGEKFQSGFRLAEGNLTSTASADLASRYQIKNIEEMNKYNPNQYEKISGNVYLKPGEKATTNPTWTAPKINTPASSTQSQAPVKTPAPTVAPASTPAPVKYATVWRNNDPTTKKVVTVGDPNAFSGGYSLYTGK